MDDSARTPLPTPSFRQRLCLWDQYFVPQRLLTRLMFRLTRVRAAWFKNWQIGWVIQRFQVDPGTIPVADPLTYPDFNSFFTRALPPGARPVVSGADEIACPADSTVSQAGPLTGAGILQAKGHYYSVASLLGGSQERAAEFEEGSFATLYLSPRDYHRVHMPANGRLRELVYVPGALFSVSPRTTDNIPDLFARNERLIALFDTDFGPMAVILVGAMCVAGIETIWTGLIPHSDTVREWDYRTREPAVTLDKGAELGRFNMGSTVIVLFGPGRVTLAPALQPGAKVKMGQLLATRRA